MKARILSLLVDAVYFYKGGYILLEDVRGFPLTLTRNLQ